VLKSLHKFNNSSFKVEGLSVPKATDFLTTNQEVSVAFKCENPKRISFP
jgi:hypothetical protein